MNLAYYILPTSPIHDIEALELSNKSYELWEKIWFDTFSAKGVADKLVRDYFLRSQKLTVITNDSKEIIGIHLYTFMNFESKASQASSFFKNIGDNIPNSLVDMGIRSGICMEYLSVNPIFRKSTSNIPFGELLIGLGCQIMKEEKLDCVFGTSREDVKVDKMAKSFGGFVLRSGIEKYGYPCSLTIISHDAKSESGYEERDELVSQLWKNRVDLIKNKKPYFNEVSIAA